MKKDIKNQVKKSEKAVEKKNTIIPLGDRVLLRPFSKDDATHTTDLGIIIPDTIDKEKPEQGKVIAVGEGKYHDGVLVPVKVSVGDVVVFSKYAYDEIKVSGEELYILKEENILAVIKNQ